ncbi:MAG TPA: glutamate 5-kinase [Gammaproteobacteria bacterium]|nr:glutamate 5-kinase [Gammaproteobacteria bacterium]
MATSNANLDYFDAARRIVVKIGSSLFIDPKTDTLDRAWLEALADDVAELHGQGREVVIVSSGAVALGRRELGLDRRKARLEDNQAAAAAGQIVLAHAYKDVLGSRGIKVAQVLLTLDDSESRRRYLNAVRTLTTLMRARVVPVINENDTVATAELRYGDNDRLAGRVAQMISADCLVVLSDVDGLYDRDPQQDDSAQHIPEVTTVDARLIAMAGGAGSSHGSGGMRTKLEAARIAVSAGCRMVITSGHVMRPIRTLREGARATWFLSDASPQAARKQWIAGSLRPKGRIVVDDGASRALAEGRSLLPAGVVAVEGEFGRGDSVSVVNGEGREVARGLVAYSCDEAAAIAGKRSADIAEVLGYRGRNEMIHRDDLVLTASERT